MRVLGFTGMPGSGKSEAMEVAKRMGLPVVRMGDLVWEEVARQGLPRDALHVGQVANAMRQAEGPDVWSRRTVERVREVAQQHPVILIDGIRSHEEVETFRRELGEDFILIAIHTDRAHRFERMRNRRRADDSVDPDVMRARDEREIGWGIARTIALADEMLVNDSTLEAFRGKVGALLDRLASTALKEVRYDAGRQALRLEFLAGGTYEYMGVPPQVHERLLGAASPGAFFSENIRDRYPAVRLE